MSAFHSAVLHRVKDLQPAYDLAGREHLDGEFAPVAAATRLEISSMPP